MPTQRDTDKALKETEGPIEKAFLGAVQAVVTAGSVRVIRDSLDDYDAIMDHIGLNRSAMNDVVEQVRGAYKQGGHIEAPAAKIRFDMRNEAAEDWLREHASRFVTRITAQQRDAIRAVVEAGTRLGQNPRQTALDIIGRVSRQTGNREGGIVGLSDAQARYVSNAREQLRSGDPAQMRQYLTRSRRDRRFDPIVRKAIDQGRPVSRESMNKIVGRYSDRLLKTRGDTIARTEALQAFNAARQQAWDQAADEGRVKAENITKRWVASGDGRVRDSHAALNGQTARKNELFHSPTGALMDHPGDRAHGAGAEDIIQCRCQCVYKVNFMAEAR